MGFRPLDCRFFEGSGAQNAPRPVHERPSPTHTT